MALPTFDTRGRSRPAALSTDDLETLKEAADMGLLSDKLRGKHVVLTGALSLRREDIATIIKLVGGHIDASVAVMTNLVVEGDNGGRSRTVKLVEAAKRGVEVISEAEFVELLSVV